ncbi:aldehyde dehydrogenase family protein [Amycolatopsis sp. NPDC051372]|uniref:aldehyde dehydrogenase family protein n=1 Tax=Amycolatopsis sp. NPDC051372 TaxID=3155669 RepID=UPI0034359FC2
MIAPRTTPYVIDALIPSGPYRSRHREELLDVTGAVLGELTIAPPIVVSRAMSGLRKGKPMPRAARIAALRNAAARYCEEAVAGLDLDTYRHLVSRLTGLGITEVSAATERVANSIGNAYDEAQYGRPISVSDDTHSPAAWKGTGLWARRGDVFAVLAAGNHPAVHAGWLQALALGYRVAIRPSRREPLTAHRLVSALHEAGFSTSDVVMLPTTHDGADEIMRASDLAMVYGGQEVIDKYDAKNVLARGPGRSKILVAAPYDWRDQLDLIALSVTRGGGTGCTNATCVLVEGDMSTAAELAQALAERLAQYEPRPPDDPQALLPAARREVARGLNAVLAASASETIRVLGGGGVMHELGDSSAVLTPAIQLLSEPAQTQTIAVELPFPCVWVSSWSSADGLAPLRNSVHLTLMTDDEDLIEQSLEDPTIRSTFVGPVPTTFSDPAVPHEGIISEFLMTPKGFLRQ